MKISELTNEAFGVAGAAIKSAFSNQTTQDILARSTFQKNFVSKMLGNITAAIQGGMISAPKSNPSRYRPNTDTTNITPDDSEVDNDGNTETNAPISSPSKPSTFSTPTTHSSTPPTAASLSVQTPAQRREMKLRNAQAVAQRQMNTSRITEDHFAALYAIAETANAPRTITQYVMASMKKMLGPVRANTNNEKLFAVANEIEQSWNNTSTRKSALVKMANLASAISAQSAYDDGTSQPAAHSTEQQPAAHSTEQQPAQNKVIRQPSKVDQLSKQLEKMSGLTANDYGTILDTIDAKLRSSNNPALTLSYRNKLQKLRNNI